MSIKVGDLVDYHGIIGGPVTSTGHTVRSIIKDPNDFGQPVAFLSGKAGCVAMAALTPASSLEFKKAKVLKALHYLSLEVDEQIATSVRELVIDLMSEYEKEIQDAKNNQKKAKGC